LAGAPRGVADGAGVDGSMFPPDASSGAVIASSGTDGAVGFTAAAAVFGTGVVLPCFTATTGVAVVFGEGVRVGDGGATGVGDGSGVGVWLGEGVGLAAGAGVCFVAGVAAAFGEGVGVCFAAGVAVAFPFPFFGLGVVMAVGVGVGVGVPSSVGGGVYFGKTVMRGLAVSMFFPIEVVPWPGASAVVITRRKREVAKRFIAARVSGI